MSVAALPSSPRLGMYVATTASASKSDSVKGDLVDSFSFFGAKMQQYIININQL